MNNSFDLALNYLTYRPRTIKEIRDYLKKKKFKKEVIEETINKLIEYNYLNDREFVRLAYESNKIGKKLSPKRLEYSLKNKGVKKEDLEFLEELFTPEEIEENCLYHFEKLKKRTEGIPYNKRIRKIMYGLNSKGYSYNDYSNLISEIEKDDEIDFTDFAEQFEKVIRRFKNKGYSGRDLKNRVIKSLIGKGYDYTMINDYFNEIDNL